MRFKGLIGCFGLLLLASASSARAQGVFTGGATAFDPQVRVVNSGALLDATAVVSRDMKYVTITARPSLAQLVALRTFPIALPSGLGFVGSPAITRESERELGLPTRGILPTPSPLDRRGITRID